MRWHHGSWIWIPILDLATLTTFSRHFQKLALSPILRRCKYGVANFLTLNAMTHIMRPYKGHCGFRRMHLKGWKTITKLLLFHIHLARLSWVRPFIGNIKALTTQPRVCTCSSKYIALRRDLISFSQSCWKKYSLKGEIQIRACWIISSEALSLCSIDRNQNNSFCEIPRRRLDLGAWTWVLPLKKEFD